MSDPILLVLMRQLFRQGLLSDMDVEAMAIDLEAEGFTEEAFAVQVAFIEASCSDGGNEGP